MKYIYLILSLTALINASTLEDFVKGTDTSSPLDNLIEYLDPLITKNNGMKIKPITKTLAPVPKKMPIDIKTNPVKSNITPRAISILCLTLTMLIVVMWLYEASMSWFFLVNINLLSVA